MIMTINILNIIGINKNEGCYLDGLELDYLSIRKLSKAHGKNWALSNYNSHYKTLY